LDSELYFCRDYMFWTIISFAAWFQVTFTGI